MKIKTSAFSKLLTLTCIFLLNGNVFSVPAIGPVSGRINAAAGNPVPFPASNGVLDATFGTNGIISTAVGIGNDVAQAVAIQADGKILAAGFAFNGANNDFAVVRYNPNGTLDTTFGLSANGIVMTPVGTADEEAFGITMQSDGKFIIVGQSSNGTNTDIAVVRYNPDGSLDNTFDSDGRLMIGAGPGNDLGRSVTVQNDGKIVITGQAFNGSNFDIAVVRLNADGSLDAGFDGDSGSGNGIVTTSVGGGNDFGYTALVQPDGMILIAGYFVSVPSTDTIILRYDANGRLDNGFAGDGMSRQSFSTDDTDEALAMALQPDGKIVIAGCYRSGGLANEFLFARFEPDGSLDPTFGTNGSLVVPFSNSADLALGVVIQTDGKIVAAGFGSNGTNNDFSVARVNTDGTLDTSFNGTGRQQTMIGTGTDSANAIALQADGKIVVVGRAVIGSTADFGVVRYGYGNNAQANDGFIELGPATAIRFDNAFLSGSSSVTPLNPNALEPLPAGWSFLGSPRSIETSALFSGDIFVKLTLPLDIELAAFESVRILQFENNIWTDKTTGTPPRDFATKTIYARVSTLGVFTAAAPSIAANITVSGRVTTPGGLSLRSAAVTITDANGVRVTTFTSPFGVYSFPDVQSQQTYTISVASKRYRFSSRVLAITDNISDLNFTGLE